MDGDRSGGLMLLEEGRVLRQGGVQQKGVMGHGKGRAEAAEWTPVPHPTRLARQGGLEQLR